MIQADTRQGRIVWSSAVLRYRWSGVCGNQEYRYDTGRMLGVVLNARIGLNFSHRISQAPAPPSAPVTPATFPTQIAHRPSVAEAAPMVKPAPPTAPRAAHPPTTGAPHKPTNAPPPGPLSNIRGIATRPPQPPARPSAPTNPVAATANGTPAQPSAQSSMPAKPPAQARPPRGAGSLAGQALAAAGVTKDRTSEGKTMTDSPASSKPTAPPAGKSETPSAAVKPPNTGSTSKPATPGPSGKAAAASATSKAAASGATGKAKTAAEQKATGPADNKTAPSVNSASTNGEPTDSTPPTEDAADKGHSRDASTDAKPSSPTKKSLYVKGIPVPTTQDELKALFKSADKVSGVRPSPNAAKIVNSDHEREDHL